MTVAQAGLSLCDSQSSEAASAVTQRGEAPPLAPVTLNKGLMPHTSEASSTTTTKNGNNGTGRVK